MASRQNRKKKGRANQQNRERTVTTLTEDPNTQFLVPTPSEEPAGANMSSPFSVSSSSGAGPNNNIPNGNYQNFAFSGPPYNSSSYMGPIQHGGNVQYYQQQPALPSGKTDIEILEELKAQIKAGQHDRFQPTPQPHALLAVYQEGLQSETHYAQQGVTDFQGAGFNQTDYDVGSATSDTGTKTALSIDASRGLPRIQTKDDDDPSGARRSIHSSPVSGPQAIIKVPSIPNRNVTLHPLIYFNIRRAIQRRRQEIDMAPTMSTISQHLRPNQEMIRSMFQTPRLLLMVQQAPILLNLPMAGSGTILRSNEVKIPAIQRTISAALQATALWQVSMVRGRGLRLTCRLSNPCTMAKGMFVLAGTLHGSRGMVLLLRTINVVDLIQTARDLLPVDQTATLILVLTAMMQIPVVPCPETRGSMTVKSIATEIETATEKETGTVTGTVIDGLIIVAMAEE